VPSHTDPNGVFDLPVGPQTDAGFLVGSQVGWKYDTRVRVTQRTAVGDADTRSGKCLVEVRNTLKSAIRVASATAKQLHEILPSLDLVQVLRSEPARLRSRGIENSRRIEFFVIL
jgi:hypothetical protein